MVPPDSDRISLVPPYSGFDYVWIRFRIHGFHVLRPNFPEKFFYQIQVNVVVLQPRTRRNACGLGCSAFARHYLRNHCCFLFLRVLRCFSSPRSPLVQGSDPSGHWVPPFGNPRVTGHLRLTVAYRSLSRPSSPLRA